MSRALLVCGLLAWCCAPATVKAGEFSWDLSGAKSQAATGDDLDADGSALAATYYFDPVDDSYGPYSLADFFDPASRVSLAITRTRATSHLHLLGVLPPDVLQDPTTTTDDYTIGGQYWLSASKWYAGGDYTTHSFDFPSEPGRLVQQGDADDYHVFAGKYLGPKTSLELGLTRSVRESREVIDLCPPPAVCVIVGTLDIHSKITTDDVGLKFVHVRRFRSLDYSLFGGVVQTSGHSTFDVSPPPSPPVLPVGTGSLQHYWTYSVGAEAFPTTKLGVRVGYTWANYENSSNDTYGVAGTWFFKRNVGIQLSWSRSQAHADFTSVPSADTTNFRFIGRF